ncbi:hypothetical protein FRC19_006440 [Serendipita sp. 401]|nr:hypothetical protein FRC19_006440 [Serendipita sp. 401]KAG9058550.1 hypothetical protein FS842_008847 [Serendipita sp. 407]
MANLSIAERVPVEIWYSVLPLAFQTWLLPNDGGDVIDGILLFADRCESVVEYTRIENTRRRLRAVCRIWKAIVDNLDIDVTSSDFKDSKILVEFNFFLSTRIELRSKRRCNCKRCPEPWGDPAMPPKEHRRIPSTSPHITVRNQSLFHSSRAQVYFLDLPPRDMTENIRFTSHLAAFEGCLGDLDYQKGLKVESVFERLTHLSLSLWPDEMNAVYQFPHLRFLQVTLYMDWISGYAKDSHIPLWSWVLPKLVSLIVRGSISEPYTDDLLKFLQSHTSTIENLVLDYQYDGGMDIQSYRVDGDLLRQCPRLRTLGLAMNTLSSIMEDLGMEGEKRMLAAAPVPTPICESLLLDNIITLVGLDGGLLQSHADQCVRICTSPAALFERIVTAYSWEELYNLCERRMAPRKRVNGIIVKQLASPIALFETIYKSDIKFVDREGIELREGSGMRFLERMREIDRDPGSLVAPGVGMVGK